MLRMSYAVYQQIISLIKNITYVRTIPITLWQTDSCYFAPLVFGFGLLHGAFAVYLMCWGSKRRSHARSDSYQALLSVFIPTSSAWPSRHAALLNSLALARSSKVLSVSASVLLKNIIDGIIEPRNPQDLSHIFRSHLRVYGWTVCFSLDLHWRVSSLVWILGSLVLGNPDKIQDEDCSTCLALI
ncbi:hypothetical protein H2248_009270 [Termitomyces sp. 'cryptogamus']|nr:hypothetical protein H2248_009270 [Termitomyces sp. 'cryptogamus']